MTTTHRHPEQATTGRPAATALDDAPTAPAAPVGDPDVAYVAWLFQRTALLAERAVGGAVAAGVALPGWVGSAGWLYEYLAWTLARQATRTTTADPAPAGPDTILSGHAPAAGGSRAPAGPPLDAPPAPASPPPSPVPARARLGVHRCLACGRWGVWGFVAASALLRAHQARTWRCADTGRCTRRRRAREARRGAR